MAVLSPVLKVAPVGVNLDAVNTKYYQSPGKVFQGRRHKFCDNDHLPFLMGVYDQKSDAKTYLRLSNSRNCNHNGRLPYFNKVNDR